MTGAELMVRCLEAAGIDTIFGIPGEENAAFMAALDASGIDFVLTRHEQGAAFMASVHGRLTGRPAACLSTLGPGATNLVTGVADAHLDHVPLLALTAQGERSRLSVSESHQIVDLDRLFEPVTKLSRTIASCEEIAGAVAEAVRRARAPVEGAVHLSLPEDVSMAEIEGEPVVAPQRAVPLPDPDTIVTATERLVKADRPLLLCGAGVLRAGAAAALRDFAEAHGIAVATTFMAKGLLPPDHELGLGAFGFPTDTPVGGAIAAADLVLAVGVDPVEYPVSKLPIASGAPVIHLAETAAVHDAGWRDLIDMPGAIPAGLKALSLALADRRWSLQPAMSESRNALRKRLADGATDAGGTAGLNPRAILGVVNAQLDPGDVILSGVGAHKLWVAHGLTPLRPGQVIIPNGLAGMGLALPGAIAAARLCGTGGRALAICGDGDVMMNVQEMETAGRLGVPMTVLVWEDGAYGLIEWEEERQTGQLSDLRFSNPDWAGLARTFGWQHAAIPDLDTLSTELERSRAASGPVLLSLRVDYSEEPVPYGDVA